MEFAKYIGTVFALVAEHAGFFVAGEAFIDSLFLLFLSRSLSLGVFFHVGVSFSS